MNGNDPLPSWSQGAAKSAVLEGAGSVTEPGASYVPPAERIATFDNDGTLWCEKPQYAEAEFIFRRWKQMVAGWGHGVKGRPLYLQEGNLVTHRSVGPAQYGRFLINVFEEWVRDTALANW